MGRRPAVAMALAMVWGSWPGRVEGASYRRLVGKDEGALSVQDAAAGAQRRLQDDACLGLLDEFEDASGRTLRSNLDALGLTAGEYIDRLVFYDGEEKGRCRSEVVLAMTQPGSRAVLVCGRRFVKTWRQDRRQAEMVVIHEALHTLGLGENPPTSQAINTRVFERCHR